jgi:hypothetical protein F3_01659
MFSKALTRQIGHKLWEVTTDFTYLVCGFDIKVPAGFITDLASTPKYLWLTFPPFGRYTDAAIVHDYLYSAKCVYQNITREQSDKIFLELMKSLGVPKWKRVLMYRGVRMFGWMFFRKKEKENV